jgi:hypothetical protein
MTPTTPRQRGGPLHREVRTEDPAEPVLRSLAGTRLVLREELLDLRGAIRHLAGHGWDRDGITAVLAAMSGLAVLAVRGDGWQLLSGVFAHGDMNEYILITLTEADL